MMAERTNVATLKGGPVTLVGNEIKVGDTLPNFKAVGLDLADVDFAAHKGKVRVFSVFLSIDTAVCANQTRTFNEKAAALSDDVAIFGVSMDLPFAQSRFCGAEGIERIVMASDYKYRSFGDAFGVYVKEVGLLARSVFVVDRNDKVVYADYLSEVTNEPDYEAALAAIKKAL
jgi:thiol peroxidase